MARVLIHHAQSQGMDLSLLAPYHPTVMDESIAARASLPFATIANTAEGIVRLVGDSHLCLHLGEYPAPTEFGLAGFYAAAADDNRTFINEIYELAQYTSNVFDFHLDINPSMGRFVLEPTLSCEQVRYFADLNLSCFFRGMQRWVDPEFQPWEVRLPHGARGGTQAYRSLFQCKVSCGGPAYELRFDPRIGEHQPLSRDARLRAALAPHVAQEKLMLIERTKMTVGLRVRAIIESLMRGRAPTQEEIAHRLKISTRTLQHKLAREDLTYRDLVDQARQLVALPAIAQGKSPVEVAENLGYEELSSFYRAFRRWTGTTPMALRSAHRKLQRSRED